MHNQVQFEWLKDPVAVPDENARAQARARQAQLTKPQGSLGSLESIAEQFAAWQGVAIPSLNQVRLRVFAADHGVAAQGVSAFPQSVTVQMVSNFCAGGAAVSVLSRVCDAEFRVVNMGCVSPVDTNELLDDCAIAPGTADFTLGPAMSPDQLARALDVGRAQVAEGEFDLFIGGEMGIGNTTSASALLAALLGLSVERVTGPGTGIDAAGLERKQAVIARALTLHGPELTRPLETLQRLGGFEITALAGAYIACGQRGIPVLVDGFISSVAALAACRIQPALQSWLMFAHQSREPGHRLLLKFLQAEPLLALNMRLGEASGAALAVPILQSALTLHREMATFSEAGVSRA
ncbi:nicotinate-nucleotide--dimethylbenzimidazole phosphoribosyltransferase [Marinimicrobium sp. ABcell2]|uniref:nicotinate-nucleotide--dimethylbenzimidazole phosphoribosyltransferase n=1 Tax=Marinimicrobium sp. ABcell2 TaxID=3069751 RepID=UPI0027B26FC3|nr:nicotinate-nucleotide--dimethylbenzimidazole phosphoribosyltransferase [Marinimicrobium sp. ABcell2]MDQ2076734.1 nicotinate-nucleotide--dimethylbenzimidazole phosphoribosyltransferase [Marinimicrobium sp. ABcell2]